MNTYPTYPAMAGNEARAWLAGEEREGPSFLCPVCDRNIDPIDDPPVNGDDGKKRCRDCHDYREEFGIDYGANQ